MTWPSISPWHCWYIVNETHKDVNLRHQPNIKILRLDQLDFWCRLDMVVITDAIQQKEIFQRTSSYPLPFMVLWGQETSKWWGLCMNVIIKVVFIAQQVGDREKELLALNWITGLYISHFIKFYLIFVQFNKFLSS